MPSWATALLVEFFLSVFAAVLGSWLWAQYDASDFASRLSVVSTQKKIMKLEERLGDFEAIHNDTRRYITRVINLAVLVLENLVAVSTVSLAQMMLLLICSMKTCVSPDWMAGILTLVAFLLMIILGLYVYQLILESLPNTYKQRLQQRIIRLRNYLGRRRLPNAGNSP
jgi:hypothetical protein